MLNWKKNKRLFIFLATALVFLSSAILWGIRIYSAKPEGIREKAPDIEISLEEFVKAFETNAKSAHARFHQKIIELQGQFSEIKKNTQFIHLNYKGKNYDVNISLDTTEKKILSQNKLKVKARYVGYEASDPDLMLPGIIRLKNGIITNQGD